MLKKILCLIFLGAVINSKAMCYRRESVREQVVARGIELCRCIATWRLMTDKEFDYKVRRATETSSSPDGIPPRAFYIWRYEDQLEKLLNIVRIKDENELLRAWREYNKD